MTEISLYRVIHKSYIALLPLYCLKMYKLNPYTLFGTLFLSSVLSGSINTKKIFSFFESVKEKNLQFVITLIISKLKDVIKRIISI